MLFLLVILSQYVKNNVRLGLEFVFGFLSVYLMAGGGGREAGREGIEDHDRALLLKPHPCRPGTDPKPHNSLEWGNGEVGKT